MSSGSVHGDKYFNKKSKLQDVFFREAPQNYLIRDPGLYNKGLRYIIKSKYKNMNKVF